MNEKEKIENLVDKIANMQRQLNIVKIKERRGDRWMVEELHMTPVCQVFIMVLIQGAKRSSFHHRKDLFLFTFATKVPQEVVFTKAHFSFFLFFKFQNFRKSSSFLNLDSAPIRDISHDKPRPQKGMWCRSTHIKYLGQVLCTS